MGRCRLVVLDKTIDVACAPERVYELLTRPDRAPSWQPWTREAAALGPDRFAMVHEVLGIRLAWVGEAETDPVRRLTFHQERGEFEAMEGTWDVEDAGGGTVRIRLRMRVALPFVLPVMLTDAEIERALSTNLDEALYNLKTVLEGRTPRERPGAGLPRARPT